MLFKIDVIYQNGEVIAVRNPSFPSRRKVLKLTRGVETDLEMRFCNEQGEAAELIAPADFGRAQVLLSCRDRLLLSTEENIVFTTDETGFQLLRIEKMLPDSDALRQLLADSYLEVEPKWRGRCECEFSVAIYSNCTERAMQLFFSIETLISDAVTAE